MKRKSMARNALFTSIISLLLCVSMLVGTTFAWFTDSVTSANNVIASGNLDIELEYSKDAKTWATVSGASDLFSNALWEPGHTQIVYLRLSNKGTLALNYQFGINIVSETPGINVAGQSFKLSDHIKFGVVENQSAAFADRATAVAAVSGAKPLNAGYTAPGTMLPDAADKYMALVVFMPESVGNEANYMTGTTAPEIKLGISAVATQQTYENDSFGPTYDILAQGGYVSGAAPEEGTSGTYNIPVTAEDSEGTTPTTEILGTMEINSASVKDLSKDIEIRVIPTANDENVTVAANEKAQTYEITVSNIKEDNKEPIKVVLNIGAGLTGVKLYHNDKPITFGYDPKTGILNFATTSFSPYTIVFNAESSVDPDVPQAYVKVTGAKKVTLVGGEDTMMLETSFQFQPKDAESVENSPYKYWHADFVVSADRDVPGDSMALAGYYTAFAEFLGGDYWVPMTSSETIEAGTEIRLVETLGTTVNYEEICNYGNDGTGFLCGATDLTGVNAGTTLKVELRLYETKAAEDTETNTKNEETGKYITIGTYSHTFGAKTVTTAAELAKAIGNGVSQIKLGADLNVDADTMITVPEGEAVVLDLNGYDISANFTGKTDGASAIFTIGKNASLTVNGYGNVHSVAAQTKDYVSSIFTNLGTLVINGGNYSMTYGTYAEGYLIPTIIDTNSNIGKATTTINGGTFTHTRNMFRNFAQAKRGENNATLIINGGTFTGKADDFAAIWNQKTSGNGVEGDGIVTVNGGIFNFVEVTNDFATGVTIAEGINLKIAE